LRQKEQTLFGQTDIGKDDKDWLLQELKKFRTSRSDEHAFMTLVYEFRERLFDGEIKNLVRTMKTVTSFKDMIEVSNSIIDSVIKDIQKKVIEKKVDNENIKLISDLILENCKLRKIANDYTEAINQGTLDKLEKFKKFWPTAGKLADNAKKNTRKSRIWNNFPLFDFFTGEFH